MTEAMKLHDFSKRTQETTLYAVFKLACHFNKSPDKITNEELRQYLLYPKDRHSRNTLTITLCGIKFLLKNQKSKFWDTPKTKTTIYFKKLHYRSPSKFRMAYNPSRLGNWRQLKFGI
ncbi:hypothetical protein BMS3Bbin03_01950 [bacterium BMS3Bbin03]|nr:hypothetical protein BMS3Bbin03_01950 [bacterium BMS3Bbin03]